jgi:hypothetical protein
MWPSDAETPLLAESGYFSCSLLSSREKDDSRMRAFRHNPMPYRCGLARLQVHGSMPQRPALWTCMQAHVPPLLQTRTFDYPGDP